MSDPEIRPFVLCVERDRSVRSALYAAAGDRLHFRFEDSLTEAIATRDWSGTIPPVRAAIVEIHDPDVATVALLARLREANPGLPVLVTTRYAADYQLAADRLAALSEEIVLRPFEAEPLLTTIRGLCLEGVT